MVAYSFKKRFAPMIVDGTKRQTIRGDRARHARVGEAVQLYVGMRTKHCVKIISDPICTFTGTIHLDFSRNTVGIWAGIVGETTSFTCLFGPALDPFAQADGFEGWSDLCRFWEREHGASIQFTGKLIKWEPQHG